MSAEPVIEYEECPQPIGRFDWERVIRRVSMPPGVKFLALTLATYASRDGSRVMPGVSRLARVMEVSERTVNRGSMWLRENGFVTLTKQGNRHAGLVNEYHLTVPLDILERFALDPDERV